jgi:hypothetical protein
MEMTFLETEYSSAKSVIHRKVSDGMLLGETGYSRGSFVQSTTKSRRIWIFFAQTALE